MFFKKAKGKKLLKLFPECVGNVKLSLFRVLHTFYNEKNEHSYESSVKLAGALVNKIFGETTTNAEAASWLYDNRTLVEEEFLNLGAIITDLEDHIVITETIQVNNVLKSADLNDLTNDIWNKMESDVDQLKEIGIFVPNHPQPSFEKFVEDSITYMEKITSKYPSLAK